MAHKNCHVSAAKEKLKKDNMLKTPYVSRGGIKLEKAFSDFNLTAEDKKAADIGSSTGGFTDFLLKNGASEVIAVDVGYGITAWKLRQDPRVHLYERTNIRNLNISDIPYLSEITVVDLSFISIKAVFKKILEITDKDGIILLLVKPQFEARRQDIKRGGIVREITCHIEVLSDMIEFLNNFCVEIKGLTFSKLRGTKGNIEFWIYLKMSASNIKKPELNYDKIVRRIAEDAHKYYGLNLKL